MKALLAIAAPVVLMASLALSCRQGTKNVGALLEANDIATLDAALNGIQQRFEEGGASEIELRDAFRPFYKLNEGQARNLHGWAASHPTSYAAHLAEGIYFKKNGLAARGDKYIHETSRSALDEMKDQFARATPALVESRRLTKKPYLTIFHLLDIALQEGDHDTARALLAAANEMLPTNSLVRNRYLISLMPRWGGSYSEAEAFIAEYESEGGGDAERLQLEAILHDDRGHALEERGDHAAAMGEFTKALELGKEAGGSFRQDFLPVSRYYVCSGANAANYCN